MKVRSRPLPTQLSCFAAALLACPPASAPLAQLGKWFTWFVLVAFLTSAVFWVTRLNKVRVL
jgi:hypothetical protein